MATASKSEPRRTEELLYRLLKVLRGSLLLSIVAIGVVLLLVAAVFESGVQLTSQDGIIAGMLGVFGISAIVSAGSFYLLLKRLRRD
ncbi:hypothetical protein [Natronococcus wangiae]|uniref:hypothetical protein n=1 Tax=Natronococcus wangiae TaxID=3068275 RepID=UPI00273E9B52|nr:hypothetical protein [Natronococcus sp. AD5]